MTKAGDNLTPRQARFAQEYLIDLNATQAAIRAGYSARGAEVQGSRLLGYANVAAAVQAGVANRSKRTEVTQDRVLKELARIGFGDLRCAFDDAGRLKLPAALSDDAAAALASIEVVTRQATGGGERGEIEYVHKIRAWDKVAALQLLGRHLKMFTDKHELAGEDGGPIRVFINGDDAKL